VVTSREQVSSSFGASSEIVHDDFERDPIHLAGMNHSIRKLVKELTSSVIENPDGTLGLNGRTLPFKAL
jgi:hypothetical protein